MISTSFQKQQKYFLQRFFGLFLVLIFSSSFAQKQVAPAYPLITHNPYFSILSSSDILNESTTKHWTGSDQSLIGIIKVDNNYYRFLGKSEVKFKELVSLSDETKVKYTNEDPGAGWNEGSFNSGKWKSAASPFSNDSQNVKTFWSTKDLWIRREFELKDFDQKNLFLKISHDDNVGVYLNGKNIYSKKGWTSKFVFIDVNEAIRSNLEEGKNLLAIHCVNTSGGAFLDAAIVEKLPPVNYGNLEKAVQKNVEITATQTNYNFICGDVDLNLKFVSPLLIRDIEIFARPVSYVSFKVKSNDGKPHKVKIYFGASSDIAVNIPSQEVEATASETRDLKVLKVGTTNQPVLKKKGDDVRIDWGYFYVAAKNDPDIRQNISVNDEQGIASFLGKNQNQAQKLSGKSLMLNSVLDFGTLSLNQEEKFLELAYDEIFSVQYFHQNLRPWWNRKANRDIQQQLEIAFNSYDTILKKCSDFDKEIDSAAKDAGGEEYAKLCELAFRQSVAAHSLTESPKGEILFLSKENFSNGSINTVDVTYPSSPLYLCYNPELLKGMLNGIFDYTESGKWKKPFPAHDLGTYPLANGQTYGEDMPVEEAGNMVILTATIAKTEGNAKYAQKHWQTLTGWVEFLEKEGFDPGNQLCTDDFAGHLARNANLSVKAIIATGSYGMMAEMLGKKAVAEKYTSIARNMAKEWMKLADAGDHYALTFDNKNTWSQKYNLVWDKVLDLNIFPQQVAQKEVAFYLTKQNKYGIPLDSRKTYTKSDWIIWSATLSGSKSEFEQFVKPVYKYITETSDRVPVSDWHESITAKKVGFQARSVVGGYFMKILNDNLNNQKQ